MSDESNTPQRPDQGAIDREAARRANIKAEIVRLWATVRDKTEPALLEADDNYRRWWPTLKQHTPDFDLITTGFYITIHRAFQGLLTVWLYGYAQALEDLTMERIRLRNIHDAESRLPDWLIDIVTEASNKLDELDKQALDQGDPSQGEAGQSDGSTNTEKGGADNVQHDDHDTTDPRHGHDYLGY